MDSKIWCFSPDYQCRIQAFFVHINFLKFSIGQFSDTQKPPIIVAECPKIFDVQCIWGRTFESLEKIFVLSIHRLYFI